MIATTSTQNRRILKLTERAALLDLDGTLIDSNYQHAVAWYRAFRAHEIVLPLWRIHRHVGMGGDQLVSAITDDLRADLDRTPLD